MCGSVGGAGMRCDRCIKGNVSCVNDNLWVASGAGEEHLFDIEWWSR